MIILGCRYLVPHKSLDEDPVDDVVIDNVAPSPGNYSIQVNLEDEVEGEEDHEVKISWLSVCDRQYTLLPKLRRKEPLYYSGMKATFQT